MSSDEKNRYLLFPVACPSDCDFESDFIATYGIESKLVVNASIRVLNSIYYNAPRVEPGDEGHFAGYCLTTLGAIYRDRQVQMLEKIVFPLLQKKQDMTPFVKQHASYRDRINTFTEYMESVAAKGPYDGKKIRELLESFGDELVQTMCEEVKALVPERLKEYDDKEINEMWQARLVLLKKLVTDTPALLFVIGHHDPQTAPNWPFHMKYTGPVDQLQAYADTQGYWKFAPYSVIPNSEEQKYALN